MERSAARDAMGMMMSGDVDEAQVSALLGAIQPRGVRVDELTGFAEAMRDRAITVPISRTPLIDTCGTGGDGLSTFNFSTAAALIAAAAGAAVAKHGNRAVSSRAGSADVLEALGVAVDCAPSLTQRSIEQAGFGFLFAPLYHPAMKHVARARKAIGLPTVFNLLGPLTNPARVRRQVMGVRDLSLVTIYAATLLELGVDRAMIVHGEDGMDELSVAGATFICHIDERGGIQNGVVTPEELGLPRADPRSLVGGDAAANARVLEHICHGEGGPLLDGTLLNASAALLVAGSVPALRDGVEMARDCIRSGRAAVLLEELRLFKREPSDA